MAEGWRPVAMNYFAHALPFLDDPDADPYLVAGTALPDWLNVADRRVRLRAKHVAPLQDESGVDASLRRGVMQHWADDARFHGTRAFAETSLALTVAARDALPGEDALRPGFLGHLLAEVLLDAALIAEAPGRLERYYVLLDAVDGARVQAWVNRVGPRPTERLAPMILAFCRERVLWDYLEDGKLLLRLNQVMRRLGLGELPKSFGRLLPEARSLVRSRTRGLLEGMAGGG